MYKFKFIIALVMLTAVSFTSCKSDYLDGVEGVNNSAKFTINGKTYNAEKGVNTFYEDIKDAEGVKIHDILESSTNVYFKLGTLLNENSVGTTLTFESTDNVAFSEIVLPAEGDVPGKKYTSVSGSIEFVSENEVRLTGCKFLEFGTVDTFVDVEGVINFTPTIDDISYCETKENDASSTWIESFRIDGAVDILNVSGSNDGYYDYSYYLYRLSQKKKWDVYLTPGNSGTPSFAHWKIYVDSNNDGSFEGYYIPNPEYPDNSEEEKLFVSEEIYASETASQTEVLVEDLRVPQIEEQGRYKMRVMMKIVTSASDVNDIKGCDNVGNGEIEDYTVNVVKYNS